MKWLYTSVLCVFWLVVRYLFPSRSRFGEWAVTRQQWRNDMGVFSKEKRLVWFHCASVGEFEQARPLIELLKDHYANDVQVVVTFFSASGYNVHRNYTLADLVTYLPFDLPWLVKPFIHRLQPDLVVFVKYEFWFNTIGVLSQQSVPTILISAHFPRDHWLLRWPGKFLGSRLRHFSKVFTQDDTSVELLSALGINNAVAVGDTRMDRVMVNAQAPLDLDGLSLFVKDRQVIVVGSNWPEDDELLISVLIGMPAVCIIVAPHVINDGQKMAWKRAFSEEMHVLSTITKDWWQEGRVLYIDRIGLLSRLYRLGTVAYIGGGFGKAVHNTLEAAVYGIPMVFGPKNGRFAEIQLLKDMGVGVEVSTAFELQIAFHRALQDKVYQEESRLQLSAFCSTQQGATNQIFEWVKSCLK